MASSPKFLIPKPPKNEDVTHRLWIVHPKVPTHDIVERECRIVVCEKVTYAEPLMPLRGSARGQKRFLLGAFAFYTRKQAERKKILQLIQLARARNVPQVAYKAYQAHLQLQHFQETGEVS